MKILYCLLYIHYSIVQNSNDFAGATPLIGNKVKRADDNEFPFVVSLGNVYHSGDRENQFCGGALISKRHVLTSAHCLEDEDQSDVVVTVGSIDLRNGLKFKVDTWITYGEWCITNHIIDENSHDLAIITMMGQVVNLTPAVISKLNDQEILYKKCVSVGWGVTKTGLKPRFLQKASFYVISREECEEDLSELLKTEVTLTPNYLCTSLESRARLTCGDSGSPLLDKSNNEIIGVSDSTCSNNDTENPHGQSVFARVDYYRIFIRDVLST